MSKISLKDALFNRFKAVRLLSYIEVPISRTLESSNLPITRAKRCSLRSNDHCNFTFDLSHYPFFEGNSFPLEVRKLGIPVYIRALSGYWVAVLCDSFEIVTRLVVVVGLWLGNLLANVSQSYSTVILTTERELYRIYGTLVLKKLLAAFESIDPCSFHS